MKRTLAAIALLAFTLTARADSYFYGAFWETRIDKVDVLTKHAGTLFVIVQDDGNFTLTRFTSASNFFTYAGHWHEAKGKRVLTTTNAATLYDWKGTADANAVRGTFRGKDSRGSFQATRQAMP